MLLLVTLKENGEFCSVKLVIRELGFINIAVLRRAAILETSDFICSSICCLGLFKQVFKLGIITVVSAVVRKQDIFVQCDKSPDNKSPNIQIRGKMLNIT